MEWKAEGGTLDNEHFTTGSSGASPDIQRIEIASIHWPDYPPGAPVDQRLAEMQAVLILARAYACYVGDEALERFKKRCAQSVPNIHQPKQLVGCVRRARHG